MHNWLSAATVAEPAGFLLDHVADAVVALDADWNIRYWNQAATAVYGWQAAEVVGSHANPALEVVRYLDGSDGARVLEQTYMRGEWRGEVVQRHRDGHELIIEAHTHALHDAGGAVIGMIAVNRDVTARHALGLELRAALAEAERAQRRLALLAEVSLALAHPQDPEAVVEALAELAVAHAADWCVVDLCGEAGELRRVVVKAACPALGPGALAALAAPPEPWAGDAQVITASAGGAGLCGPLLALLGAESAIVAPLATAARPLGQLILARAAARPPFSEDDRALGEELARRAAMAVTAARLRRAVEESARRAEENRALIEGLIGAAPVGFAFIDHGLRFQVINERFAACNGPSVAEHQGRAIREVVPAIAPALEALVGQVLATGEPIVELPITGEGFGPPWEGKHWLETFYPVRTPDGATLGVGVVSVEVTELRRLGLDLARSRLQLAGIIDSALDAIVTVDEGQRIVLFNQAAERLFGVAAAEVIGGPVERFIPAECRAAPRAGAAHPRALRADGASFPVERSISQLSLDGATLTTIILRDISARVAAEQQLRASEANLRAIFDNTAQSFVLLDRDHRVVLWNRLAQERTLAVTGAGLVAGALFHTIVQPALLPALQGALERAARGETAHQEHRLDTADRPLWLAVDYIPVRDAAGQVIGTCLSTLDITAQRVALEALTRSEERFRALVAEASDVIVLLDEALALRYASPAWERMLGYPSAAWEGRSPLALIHPDDRPGADQAIDAFLRGEPEPREFALRLRHRDGAWIWGEVVGTDLRAHPAVQGVVLTIRDVTERKQLTEQLLQAQKMESIGRLAGGVAHDFNNLLTAMSGYIDLALDSMAEGAAGRADIVEARRAAGRATGLTRQLLAFARKQVIAPQACSLNDLILDMGRLLHRLIGAEIALVTELSPELGPIVADPGQIEQVIVNLAVNARDAMPAGGRLTIATARVSLDAAAARRCPHRHAGEYARISVSDTGVGMGEQLRAHIFEPFFTTKGAAHGTGLGLATCYGIVSQHGGWIDVLSQPGAGSTFLVYLPYTAAPAPRPAEQPAPAPLSGSETVLVVEDDEAVRRLAARVLRDYGYTVLEAEDGAEALQLLAAQDAIQLVLSDVVMPRLSGRELVARLHDERPALPVVCMSGYTSESGTAELLRDLHVRLILKPFVPATLLKIVREALDGAAPA